jgi:hypothetical protein
MATDLESWQGAMRSDLKYMADNHVWNSVDLLDGARFVK